MVRSWSCNDFSTPRLNMAETSSKFSRLLRTILSHKYFIYLTIIRWGWVYVWCEELCRSRKSMPSIEYCLYLPNMVTVCRLWGFSRGSGDNEKQWSVLNEKKKLRRNKISLCHVVSFSFKPPNISIAAKLNDVWSETETIPSESPASIETILVRS